MHVVMLKTLANELTTVIHKTNGTFFKGIGVFEEAAIHSSTLLCL